MRQTYINNFRPLFFKCLNCIFNRFLNVFVCAFAALRPWRKVEFGICLEFRISDLEFNLTLVESLSSYPFIASNNIFASSTVFVIGPIWSSEEAIAIKPYRETVP